MVKPRSLEARAPAAGASGQYPATRHRGSIDRPLIARTTTLTVAWVVALLWLCTGPSAAAEPATNEDDPTTAADEAGEQCSAENGDDGAPANETAEAEEQQPAIDNDAAADDHGAQCPADEDRSEEPDDGGDDHNSSDEGTDGSDDGPEDSANEGGPDDETGDASVAPGDSDDLDDQPAEGDEPVDRDGSPDGEAPGEREPSESSSDDDGDHGDNSDDGKVTTDPPTTTPTAGNDTDASPPARSAPDESGPPTPVRHSAAPVTPRSTSATAAPAQGSPAPRTVPAVESTWRSTAGSARLPAGAPGAAIPRAGGMESPDNWLVRWFRFLTGANGSETSEHPAFPGIALWSLLFDLFDRSEPVALPDDVAGDVPAIAFPVLGPVSYADGWGACRDGCSRHHVGTDIMGVRMQPLLSTVDGTVIRIRTESMGTAGAILTIRDDEGWTYQYFHNNNDTPGTDDGRSSTPWRAVAGLEVGDQVRAGQVVGFMGDSGNAEATPPHVHFEIRNPAGTPVPSYWALRSAEARQACTIGIGPWSLPDAADDAESEEFTTTVTPLYGDGEWQIDSAGQVTAVGDAALILPRPDLGCDPGPTTPFGSASAGWTNNEVWAEHDLVPNSQLAVSWGTHSG